MKKDCEHKYIPGMNPYDRPYCEKCGKLMPYEEPE